MTTGGTLRLYDTRRGQAHEIVPARRGQLRVFACGPAGYRRAHLGDLRTFLLPDLISRIAQRHRLAAVTCRNITDVGFLPGDDGRLDARGQITSSESNGVVGGQAALDRARSYQESAAADCSALNIHPPDQSPRASEAIGPITGLIEQLIDGGQAYATPGGSVYCAAASFAGYHAPGISEPGDAPPARVLDDSDGRRAPADWLAWTGVPSGGGLAWPAPWGQGFPSWHIACSAMSRRDLGDVVDIHTGSIGQRFPHHENERAQSDAAAGHEVVRHWAHGEDTWFEGRAFGGAASHGDAVLLADLTARGLDPLALRLTFLEHHYREPLDLSWQALAEADRTLRGWRDQVASWATEPSRPMSGEHVAQIAAAFDDDLDTQAALGTLRALGGSPEVAAGAKFETFAHLDALLGLDLARNVGRY